MILQPRDREIIVAVHIFRLLTRGQIARLFGFSCTRRINSRLRKLFDHEYLDRSFLATVRGSGQAIYCLGLKGVDVVTRELGLDPVRVKRQRRSTRALRELFLAHALELNDVRIAFSQAIAGQPEMKLERWISNHECEQTYKIDYRGKEIARRFRPDGYLRFWHNEKIYSFFLEHDRATMSLGRFKKKVEMYIEFARLGYYRQRFGVKYFQVLVIAPTTARLANLKQAVETVTDRRFLFTTLEQITSEAVFGPIWQRVGRQGHFPLMRL